MSSQGTPSTRTSALLGAVIAAALLLSACSVKTSSDNSTGTSTSSSAASLLPAAESKTEYPLTLETPWGKSDLTERPQRVAAVGASAMDAELLLSLGVTPVTTMDAGYSQAPWLQEAADGKIENVLPDVDGSDYPFEAIAAAHPDLIVVFGYDLTDDYDKLSAIAPVIANSDTDIKWGGDWKAFLPRLGEALDLQDDADQTISDYDDKVAAIKAEVPEFEGKTASFNVYYGEKYGLDYQSVPGSMPGAILEALGLTLPEDANDFVKDGTVSDELISKIDADVVIIHDVSDQMGGSATIDTLTGSKLFKKLRASQNDNVVITTSDQPVGWAMSTGGPIGSLKAMETLVPLIKEKID